MSIDPEHEKAYSPSQWSKRGSSQEIVEHFLRTAEKVMSKARSSVSCVLDTSYGIDDRESFDVYGDNLPKDAPIFVFVHGGYWQEMSKDLASFHIENLVKSGIKVYNVGYSLCPMVTVSNIISQIKCVLRKIIDLSSRSGTKCVWIAGHSVGAHMVASLIHDLEWIDSLRITGGLKLIKGIILLAGIYNLEPLLRTSYNEALKLSSDEIKNLSLRLLDTMKYQPIRDMKIIVTVGECDAPIFIQESKLYAQKLIDFVDNVDFILLRNDIDHFNILENLVDMNYVLTKMIISLINKR